jgi:hypothetical protein
LGTSRRSGSSAERAIVRPAPLTKPVPARLMRQAPTAAHRPDGHLTGRSPSARKPRRERFTRRTRRRQRSAPDNSRASRRGIDLCASSRRRLTRPRQRPSGRYDRGTDRSRIAFTRCAPDPYNQVVCAGLRG